MLFFLFKMGHSGNYTLYSFKPLMENSTWQQTVHYFKSLTKVGFYLALDEPKKIYHLVIPELEIKIFDRKPYRDRLLDLTHLYDIDEALQDLRQAIVDEDGVCMRMWCAHMSESFSNYLGRVDYWKVHLDIAMRDDYLCIVDEIRTAANEALWHECYDVKIPRECAEVLQKYNLLVLPDYCAEVLKKYNYNR